MQVEFAGERALVAADPWYAIEQGYVFTEDEKRLKVAPMPAYRYLYILTRIWQIFPIGLVLKARQMIFSWLWCWLQLHEALYKPASLSILQGKRLDDVKAIGSKSLMGRVLFMYSHLPFFLRPPMTVGTETLQGDNLKMPGQGGKQTLTTLVVPDGGVMIAAPQGPNIIRSKTGSSVQMDELPMHPEGRQAWSAAIPTVIGAEPQVIEPPLWLAKWNAEFPELAGDANRWNMAKLWGVGTPNGPEWVWTKMGIERWREWPELTGWKYDDGGQVEGLRYKLIRQVYKDYEAPPILALRCHYTADYHPELWAIRRASKGAYDTIAAYERENEISCRVAEGSPVFRQEEFDVRHIRRWEIDPRRPTSLSLDTGYQGQSICFWQHSIVPVRGGLYWLRCHLFAHFLRKGWSLDDVLLLAKEWLQSWGIDHRRCRWMTDFNTLNTRHGGTGVSDMYIFRQHGIHPLARKVGPFQKDQCITLTRKLMKTWPDGRPGLELDPARAPLVQQMFDGGWRYEEPTAGRGPIEAPHKDGTYDHVGDSVVYMAWNLYREIWNAEPIIEMDLPKPGQVDWVKDRARRMMTRRVDRPTGEVGPGALWRE